MEEEVFKTADAQSKPKNLLPVGVRVDSDGCGTGERRTGVFDYKLQRRSHTTRKIICASVTLAGPQHYL